MNIKELLENKFKDSIKEIEFLGGILTITTSNEVKDQTYFMDLVDKFLIQNNINTDELDIIVQSPGLDLEVDMNNIDRYVGETLRFELKKAFLSQNVLVAQLLENKEDELLVKWNNKGQFRKVKINKENILNIELYVKF
ncbi:hypothetical protein V2E24_03120 [Mycoplasmopsis ciconiae]|uniref:Ribosome maturation factor RimP n=1 Tax=Mycoplasmopsis ciconiae TaxID=561067 RepID=A0ABU7MLZ3_9BACT|nr:hypothetical protein [Mycoplasmopsis ciconiae]